MGKKRRILTTKKFNAKHSAHPRMKMAAHQNTEDEPTDTSSTESASATETLSPPEIVVAVPTLTQEKVETKTVTPTVKKATTTKAKKTTTPRKKTTTKSTTPRKSTTKKKTTSATA